MACVQRKTNQQNVLSHDIPRCASPYEKRCLKHPLRKRCLKQFSLACSSLNKPAANSPAPHDQKNKIPHAVKIVSQTFRRVFLRSFPHRNFSLRSQRDILFPKFEDIIPISVHTGGVTGSIPVAPTIVFNGLADFQLPKPSSKTINGS